MSKVMRVVLPAVFFSMVVGVPSLWAFWVPNGVSLCSTTGDQYYPKITSDGAGGAIITWQDFRSSSTYDIYAQRVNASGVIQWTASGVALCAATADQYYPQITSDGAGGAVVTWQDFRSSSGYDIYAQRVNSSGAVQWTADGVAICTMTAPQVFPQITNDGAGGAIVTWNDNRAGSDYDIYAQRVNASGAVQWTADGVAVCATVQYQFSTEITSDGMGGAIVTWYEIHSLSSQDICAQRVDASGAVQWTADGVDLCTATGAQVYPKITHDGTGGAIVTWRDDRSGNYDIYAQRVNASGATQWTADGVALCTATGSQEFPMITSDGAGGAIVTWYDSRSGNNDIYAQRVNASGAVQWTADGVALCTATGSQERLTITSDGAGGAIATWSDSRSGNNDIYAQRVDASGAVQWTADGVALCAATGSQQYPTIASDSACGAIVTWHDARSGTQDIYVQFVDDRGRAGKLSPHISSIGDVPGDQGGRVYLSWYAARPDVFMDSEMSHYSIWRAIDPTQAAMALDAGATVLESLPDFEVTSGKPVIRIERVGAVTYFWELVETIDALYMEAYGKPVATLFDSTAVCSDYHYFQVVAHTTDPKVFWKADPDSGYSVDNLAPYPPVSLAGEQSVVPEGLSLTWNCNTEADLDDYRIYRGLTEEFVPGPGNLIASSCDTTYFDGGWRWHSGYYYKVSAVDVHGNESDYALLTAEGITGSDTPTTPAATYLAQNVPNPFNPLTRIAFGLERPASATLRIYDATGRLVAAIFDGDRPAGNYVETWDGRNMQGQGVASGVYFYRLEAGSFTQTRKMILLR